MRSRFALYVGLLCILFAPTSNLSWPACPPEVQVVDRYRLDPTRSTLVARALAGGLLWFKGKDHFIAARQFAGEVEVTRSTLTPASLWLTIDANSLVETRDIFTEAEKQIINKELREIVLEPSQYPEITFKSVSITGKPSGANTYKVEIRGNLTLHGVTRAIVIPSDVTFSVNELRARGKFDLNRDDFNIKATSAFHGLVRVRDKVEVNFDIVGQRV